MMVMFMMAVPLGMAASMATDAKAAKDAAEKLFNRLDRQSLIDPSDPSGDKLAAVKGEIEVRDVTFAYPTRPDAPVCTKLSLKISAGQMVALVGPSGCGKSTLIQLLERFYDPTAGAVLLDGADLKTLNLKWLRQQIGLVGQEPILFLGSVSDNIGYGKEGATKEEIEAAAKMANAHGFITDNLADGYNTDVGARQRVGAHRAGGARRDHVAVDVHDGGDRPPPLDDHEGRQHLRDQQRRGRREGQARRSDQDRPGPLPEALERAAVIRHNRLWKWGVRRVRQVDADLVARAGERAGAGGRGGGGQRESARERERPGRTLCAFSAT